MTTDPHRAAPLAESPDTPDKGEVLVRAEHVSKVYCRSLKRSLLYGVQDIAGEIFGSSIPAQERMGPPPEDGSGLRAKEFWAVRDVNFELRRGECLGLIGHNGAGKTSLLKMLNGLSKPSRGRITMRGRVGALIALGAGFNPILTGRENVYINGSVLGLSKKEIDAKYEEIVDFADIPDYMESPVQNYSSGMKVRLGFAVATAMEPDILLLDEVLAVGDAAFRAKCYNRVGELLKKCAVIFVSHSMMQVSQICTRAMYLEGGRMLCIGETEKAVDAYNIQADKYSSNKRGFLTTEPPIAEAKLNILTPRIKYDDYLEFELRLSSEIEIPDVQFRAVLYELGEQIACDWNSNSKERTYFVPKGESAWKFKLGPICLRGGEYLLGTTLNDATGATMLFWSYKQHSINIDAPTTGASAYLLPSQSCVLTCE